MNNPCNENCPVLPMCSEPCQDMIDYLYSGIVTFRRDCTATIHERFCLEMCLDIKKMPDMDRFITINYIDGPDAICVIEVQNGVIKGFKEHDE
jgi:hypothetical protein